MTRLHACSDSSTLVYIRLHSSAFVYTRLVTFLHSSRHVDTHLIKNRQGSQVKLHRFMIKFHKIISFRIFSQIIEPVKSLAKSLSYSGLWFLKFLQETKIFSKLEIELPMLCQLTLFWCLYFCVLHVKENIFAGIFFLFSRIPLHDSFWKYSRK